VVPNLLRTLCAFSVVPYLLRTLPTKVLTYSVVGSHASLSLKLRVGQNRMCTPYMTVCMVNSLLTMLYIHRIHVCMYGFSQPYSHAPHALDFVNAVLRRLYAAYCCKETSPVDFCICRRSDSSVPITCTPPT
jgi:hypothetical protein